MAGLHLSGAYVGFHRSAASGTATPPIVPLVFARFLESLPWAKRGRGGSEALRPAPLRVRLPSTWPPIPGGEGPARLAPASTGRSAAAEFSSGRQREAVSTGAASARDGPIGACGEHQWTPTFTTRARAHGTVAGRPLVRRTPSVRRRLGRASERGLRDHVGEGGAARGADRFDTCCRRGSQREESATDPARRARDGCRSRFLREGGRLRRSRFRRRHRCPVWRAFGLRRSFLNDRECAAATATGSVEYAGGPDHEPRRGAAAGTHLVHRLPDGANRWLLFRWSLANRGPVRRTSPRGKTSRLRGELERGPCKGGPAVWPGRLHPSLDSRSPRTRWIRSKGLGRSRGRALRLRERLNLRD
jgi:hypothetical protein